MRVGLRLERASSVLVLLGREFPLRGDDGGCAVDTSDEALVGRVSGSNIFTEVPSPSLLCTLMLPWRALTKLRTIDRPKPVPTERLSSYIHSL